MTGSAHLMTDMPHTMRSAARQPNSRPAVLAAAACAMAAAIGGCTSAVAGSGGSPSAAQAGGHRQRAPSPVPAAVTLRRVVLPDGHAVTVARFSGDVRFVLHCGSSDPGAAALKAVKAGPAVRQPASRSLVAAFNGGFKLSAGVGGYEQEGRIIRPLAPGRASLVIYRSGAVGIGVWGHGVPRTGHPVLSVRQNLGLLVADGHPTPAAANWRAWGATITRAELVARSAVGQNGRGQLIYAASMAASPADLAAALVEFGARTGMELDINPEWVQLAYAASPGGRLLTGLRGQVRPADQYLRGWTRDFIAVMATWLPVTAPGVHVVP